MNIHIQKNQRANMYLNRIINLIVLDFNLHVFSYPEQEKTITDIKQLIFLGKHTLLNEESRLPTLLERTILYYNQNVYLQSLSDMDQNILDHIIRELRKNNIQIKTIYKYNIADNVIVQLAKAITLIISRIITLKTQLSYSLKIALKQMMIYSISAIIPLFSDSDFMLISTLCKN